MRVPFVAFGNDEIAKAPRLGSIIVCPHCGKEHVVEDGKPAGILQFYKCGDKAYLAGIRGKDVSRSFTR